MTDASPAVPRCPWAEGSDAYRAYHDHEWGIPSHDDRHLFEMLILEGAQAGLSWSTILGKRENYRRAFDGFDPDAHRAVRRGQDRGAPRRCRHRAQPAQGARHGQERAGLPRALRRRGLARRVPLGLGRRHPAREPPPGLGELPARTELSDRISKDLKKRGFTFVGSTIVYSLLQAVGVVDDHVEWCSAKRTRLDPGAAP